MGKAGAKTPQILSAFYPGTTIGKLGGTVRVVVLATGARQTLLAFPNGGRVDGGGDGFPIAVPAGGFVRVGNDAGRYWAERDAKPKSTSGAASSTSTSSPSDSTTSTTLSTSESTTSTTAVIDTVPAGPTAAPTGTTVPRTTTTTRTGTTTTSTPDESRVWSSQALRAVPSGGSTVSVTERSRTYRGTLETRLDAAGLLRVVDVVDVESYLKGMGEVRNPKWPAASLRTQAIAARTYALRAMAAGGEICDDTRCQVYLGAQAEYAAMNKAVSDTASQVVLYKGKLASTVYSANAGGFSASREEGFGTSGDGYPYLRAARYTCTDPMPWTVKVALTDVAARLGYPGKLSGLAVAEAGPSGRAVQVALDGSAGRLLVPGRTFDARLGLKSTLFTLKLDTAAVAPVAPPPVAGLVELQAPPEEAFTMPPRPPDPPLPAPTESAEPTVLPVETISAAPTIPPYRTGSTNTALAVFVIVVLAAVASASALVRRRRSPFA
jgi:SpoIID/LytB domain protein